MSLLVKEDQKFCHCICHYPRKHGDKIACFYYVVNSNYRRFSGLLIVKTATSVVGVVERKTFL